MNRKISINVKEQRFSKLEIVLYFLGLIFSMSILFDIFEINVKIGIFNILISIISLFMYDKLTLFILEDKIIDKIEQVETREMVVLDSFSRTLEKTFLFFCGLASIVYLGIIYFGRIRDSYEEQL